MADIPVEGGPYVATTKVVTSDRFTVENVQSVLSGLVSTISITTFGPSIQTESGDYKRVSLLYQ